MPKLLLDLYCCEGGAGKGYADAGFEVVGVDINPQPRYPYRFIQADAVAFALEHGAEFDFVHASPPCRRYSATQRIQGNEHPDLIGPTRAALQRTGKPWVIENVADAEAELRDPVTLCGVYFGHRTYRHRLFETGGWELPQPQHAPHTARTVKMGRSLADGDFYHAVGNFSGVNYVRRDMGVGWMTRDGVRECIPPSYAEHVGRAFLGGV